MYRIGNQLLAERKAFVYASANGRGGEKVGVEKKSVQGRDLLSLLVKANMATDLPAEARLDDADVLARKLFTSCSFKGYSRLTTHCRGTHVSRRWPRNN